jgi:Rrf2 family iron-sulfur cluster assembly transcriptional regulator
MKLSTRGRYAVMAMTDLAQQHRDYLDRPKNDPARAAVNDIVPPVALTAVATRQEISLTYLEQIFQDLRKSGLVESVRGAKGGFRLARRPEDLPIGDIINSVEENVNVTRCQSSGGCLSREARCLTHDLWAELGTQIDMFLNSVSLDDVLNHGVSGMTALQYQATEARS